MYSIALIVNNTALYTLVLWRKYILNVLTTKKKKKTNYVR